METEAWIVRTWDDLVFKNRNREYGAYSIRRAYSKRVLLGAGFSAAVMAGFLVFSGVMKDVTKVVVPPIVDKDESIFIARDPAIERKPRQADPIKQPKSTNTNTTVRVVSNEVETTVTEPIDNSSFTGTTDGVEGGVIEGTSTGTDNTIVSVEVNKGPLTVAEIMPRYDGGIEAMMKFIRKKIRYPNSAKSIGIEGTVYVSFVVNGDGTVTDVTVVRGIHPKCDEEAVRVISMLPDWIGGKQNGSPVAVRMALPIKFSLDGTGK